MGTAGAARAAPGEVGCLGLAEGEVSQRSAAQRAAKEGTVTGRGAAVGAAGEAGVGRQERLLRVQRRSGCPGGLRRLWPPVDLAWGREEVTLRGPSETGQCDFGCAIAALYQGMFTSRCTMRTVV